MSLGFCVTGRRGIECVVGFGVFMVLTDNKKKHRLTPAPSFQQFLYDRDS